MPGLVENAKVVNYSKINGTLLKIDKTKKTDFKNMIFHILQ